NKRNKCVYQKKTVIFYIKCLLSDDSLKQNEIVYTGKCIWKYIKNVITKNICYKINMLISTYK
ncbi:hypothetical protein PFDG_03517, partial [Plasmodium falciparum Dd2]